MTVTVVNEGSRAAASLSELFIGMNSSRPAIRSSVGIETTYLPAKLRTDRAAGSGNEYPGVFQIAANTFLLKVNDFTA